MRQEPTDHKTGACALRGLKRSCASVLDADTDGVNDLDNALGGSYNHPHNGSRPRVSDQQLFNYRPTLFSDGRTACRLPQCTPHPAK
jgi:hypothetical protein